MLQRVVQRYLYSWPVVTEREKKQKRQYNITMLRRCSFILLAACVVRDASAFCRGLQVINQQMVLDIQSRIGIFLVHHNLVVFLMSFLTALVSVFGLLSISTYVYVACFQLPSLSLSPSLPPSLPLSLSPPPSPSSTPILVLLRESHLTHVHARPHVRNLVWTAVRLGEWLWPRIETQKMMEHAARWEEARRNFVVVARFTEALGGGTLMHSCDYRIGEMRCDWGCLRPRCPGQLPPSTWITQLASSRMVHPASRASILRALAPAWSTGFANTRPSTIQGLRLFTAYSHLLLPCSTNMQGWQASLWAQNESKAARQKGTARPPRVDKSWARCASRACSVRGRCSRVCPSTPCFSSNPKT